MRPTLLQFRSPKERTPDCYNPTLTFDGRRVSFSPVRMNDTHSSFSNSKRFTQYDIEARRTGYFVGPGSYKNEVPSSGKTRIKGTPVYKPISALNSTLNDGYIMVGDQVVFDSSLSSSSKKYSLANLRIGIDSSFTESFRSSRKRSTPRMKSAEKRTPSRLDTMETETAQSPEKPKSNRGNRCRSAKRIKSPYLSRVAKNT